MSMLPVSISVWLYDNQTANKISSNAYFSDMVLLSILHKSYKKETNTITANY